MPYTLLPQPKSITREKLERGIRSSFPPGSFNFEEGSKFDHQVKWMADALLAVYQLAQTMQDELNPGLATEMLPDWERFTINPECVDIPSLSNDQRRALIVAALRGGLPGLTLSQLNTAVTDAFPTVTFVFPTETAPLRINDDLTSSDLTADNTFLNDFAFVTVKPASATTNASVTRIMCFVGTILPTTTVFFVQRQP